VDANDAKDEGIGGGRRNRVVLTPRRWRQVGGVFRRRRWQESRSPGRSRISRKPLRAGMPGVSGELAVNTRAHTHYQYARTRLRVHWAPGIPHALIFQGATFRSNLGRNAPRECEAVFAVIASHRAALRADPVARNDDRGAGDRRALPHQESGNGLLSEP